MEDRITIVLSGDVPDKSMIEWEWELPDDAFWVAVNCDPGDVKLKMHVTDMSTEQEPRDE